MSDAKLLLKSVLQAEGYSLTKTRTAVFNALHDQEAITMRELILRVGPAVDRATIYRTVSLFEKLDVVKRVQMGWKYKLELSSSFSHHHHHLICVRCEKIVTFEESLELEEEIARTAWRNQFKLTDHQLEIRGICDACIVTEALKNLE